MGGVGGLKPCNRLPAPNSASWQDQRLSTVTLLKILLPAGWVPRRSLVPPDCPFGGREGRSGNSDHATMRGCDPWISIDPFDNATNYESGDLHRELSCNANTLCSLASPRSGKRGCDLDEQVAGVMVACFPPHPQSYASWKGVGENVMGCRCAAPGEVTEQAAFIIGSLRGSAAVQARLGRLLLLISTRKLSRCSQVES